MAVQVTRSDFPALASDQAEVNAPDRHDREYAARKRTLASDQNQAADQIGQNGPQASWAPVGHQPTRGINIDPPGGDPALESVKAKGSSMSLPENAIARLAEQNRHGDGAPRAHDSMTPANHPSHRSGGEPAVPAKLEGGQGTPARTPK